MNEKNIVPGKRCWRPDYDAQNASARLFVPLPPETMLWLPARANGRPLGVVAAEVLRTLAEAEGE